MGLTIYYSGRIKDCNKLRQMIEEVEDIAVLKGWDYYIFEDEFKDNKFQGEMVNQNLYGIYFSPPGSEPIQFTLASNGRLCSILEFGTNNNIQKERKIFYTIFSKTQYAGAEVHKVIIDLIRYISVKYFSEFKLTDESHYWETNDENILKESFIK